MAYFHTEFNLLGCGGYQNQTEATENVRSAPVLLCYNVYQWCAKITFLLPYTFSRPKSNGAGVVPASCGRASAILLLPNVGNQKPRSRSVQAGRSDDYSAPSFSSVVPRKASTRAEDFLDVNELSERCCWEGWLPTRRMFVVTQMSLFAFVYGNRGSSGGEAV
jgi:hypothetical protein